uniref:S1-like domain-containing protein n=1 Tax=viral metagenome TaxID=1070528 RepID=A0A6C0IKJ5_9ZZZZ
MVKNSGGNKSKKQARKSVGIPTVTQNVRYVVEVGEMYAVITTIYGGKTCQVMCDDGISRRCTIRRKFMTARRGDNAIAPGTWLMVGLYDWEKRSDGSQTCDILEVYSAGERDKLKQTVNAKLLKHLMAINNAMDGDKTGSEFVFSDTLAAIDQEEEEEDDDDEEEIEKIKPIIPLKDLPVVKNESVSEQMAWLTVSVDDI